MQHPEHLISSNRKGLTRERMAALVLGGVIPATFIWALIAGLIPDVSVTKIKDLITTIIPDKNHVDHPAPQQPVVDRHLNIPAYPLPHFPPDQSSDRTIQVPFDAGGGNQMAGPPDHSLQSIASTHTIPPYPPLSIRLEEQGTVTLRLEIAANGSVTNATVEKSSGSPRLDQAAVAWVIQNWRYEPQTRNGLPVATTTEAAVKFDLRNALR